MRYSKLRFIAVNVAAFQLNRRAYDKIEKKFRMHIRMFIGWGKQYTKYVVVGSQ